MRHLRFFLGAVLLSGVLVGSAGASESRTALSNVECAQQITSAWTTIGLWGPRARDVLAAVTADAFN